MTKKRPAFVPAPKTKQVKHDTNKPTYMTNFDYAPADNTHSLHLPTTGNPSRVPHHRTEEEIDRLYEYNKMMGKGGTR